MSKFDDVSDDELRAELTRRQLDRLEKEWHDLVDETSWVCQKLFPHLLDFDELFQGGRYGEDLRMLFESPDYPMRRIRLSVDRVDMDRFFQPGSPKKRWET